MLKASLEVQQAVNQLRGTPEMGIINGWLEDELRSANERFVNEAKREDLPIHQNTVRILTRLVHTLKGGSK